VKFVPVGSPWSFQDPVFRIRIWSVQSTYVKFGVWPRTRVEESAAVKAKVARGDKSMVREGPEVVGKEIGEKELLNKD